MKKILAHREQPIPSLVQERPEVSADLEAVYRKMVAKRPENRYATCAKPAKRWRRCKPAAGR